MLSLLATLLVAAPPPQNEVGAPPPGSSAPAIQVTLNNDGNYAPGGRVVIQVQTNDDGYLIVFRVDGDGRIRVLFPLDPDGDPFVRGGKEYELRGRGDRETFLADDRSGNGMVYAAVSHEPYVFRDFVANGHWDYNMLRLRDSTSDAENDLTAIVSQMTNRARFDYDAVGYRVQDIGTIASVGGMAGGYYSGYYDPYYDPSWRCLGCGWAYPGSDFSIGLNFGYSPYWDPWLYSPWAYNYGYAYGGFGYGYFPGIYPVIVGRGRPLRPLPGGTTPRPRPPIGGGRGAVAPPTSGNGRPRPPFNSATPSVVRTSPPDAGIGVRARPRPAEPMYMPRQPVAPVRPVFREPPRGVPGGQVYSRPALPSQSRPVYREPPNADRSPPPSQRGAPPPRSAPPPSARSAPPSRSAPSGGGGHGGGRH